MAINCPAGGPPAKLCHPPTRAAGFPAGGLHTLLHSLPRAAWRPAGERLDRPSGQGQPTACVPARVGPVLLSRSRGEASRHPVPSRHLLTGLPGPRVQRSCGLSGSYDWGQHLCGALLAFPARSQCQGRAWGQGRWGPRGTQSLLQAPPLLLPEWSCRSIRRWGGCPLLSRPILRGWTCRPAGTSPDDSGRPPLPSLVLTGRAGESGWGPGCEGKVGLGSGSRPPSEQAGRRLMPGSSAGLWLLSHLLLQALFEHACSQVRVPFWFFSQIDQKHKLLEGKPGFFHLHIFWAKTVLLIFLIFFFWLYCEACGILVSLPGVSLRHWAVKGWISNHWTWIFICGKMLPNSS